MNCEKIKIHKAFLKWCEDDDSTELIKLKIHKDKYPQLHKNLRNKLVLSEEDKQEIQNIGLISIRKNLLEYLDNLSMNIDHLPKKENICFINALYANGICCRKCMSVCYKINMWARISEVQKNKILIKTLQWIQKNLEFSKFEKDQ